VSFFRRVLRSLTGGLLAPPPWLIQLFGGTSTEAQENVSATTAPQVGAVYACVSLIADTIASIPFNVYRITDQGNELNRTHPVDKLISRKPSRNYLSKDFKRAVVSTMLLHGNAYILPMRTGTQLTSLELLDSTAVNVQYSNGIVMYKIHLADGQSIYLDPDQIIHLKAFTIDGFNGLSIINYAKEVIGTSMSATKQIGRIHAKGGIPKGILEMQNIPADPEKLTAAGELFSKQVAAGSTPVLPAGSQYKPIVMSSRDAQTIESMKWTVEEICRFFRVPPHKVGYLEHGMYNNSIEVQNHQFIADCIRPLVELIEEQLTEKLINNNAFTIEGNLNMLQRGDISTQVQRDVSYYNIGVLSRNEIRRSQGLSPIPGGDEYMQPMHMSNQNNINNGKENRNPEEEERSNNQRLPAQA
jgi:HK97 family phage portal protein